jgi:hypothetical protein
MPNKVIGIKAAGIQKINVPFQPTVEVVTAALTTLADAVENVGVTELHYNEVSLTHPEKPSERGIFENIIKYNTFQAACRRSNPGLEAAWRYCGNQRSRP